MTEFCRTPTARTRITIEIVAAAFGANVNEILTPRRLRPVATARQMCMALLFEGFAPGQRPRSLPQVGRIFKRDHTTVLRAVRLYRRWCADLDLPLRPDCIDSQARRIARHLGYEPVERAPIAEAEPARTLPSSPALPEVPMIHAAPVLPRLIPPVMAGGKDFGEFDHATWRELPEPMQKEAMLLFMERQSCLHPRMGEDDVARSTERAFGLSAFDLTQILDRRELHGMPGELALQRSDVLAPAARDMVDGGVAESPFADFALAHLEQADATLDVAAAYRRFLAFCRASHRDPSPRTQFGADLLRLVRPHGGRREGDVLTGLRMKDRAR